MKLTEQQIKLLIREAVIKEYRLARAPDYTIATCDRIDLPDKIFGTSETSKSTVRRAEKAAALGAQLYGVPGLFCNLVSAIVGDNSGFEINRRNPENPNPSTRLVENSIYKGEQKHYLKHRAKFVGTIATNKNRAQDVKLGAAKTDHDSYLTMVSSIKQETGPTTGKPLDVVKAVNNVLIIQNKGSVKKVKELTKAGQDANVIKGLIRDEALEFLRSIAFNNLSSSSIKSNYAEINSYQKFLNDVRP